MTGRAASNLRTLHDAGRRARSSRSAAFLEVIPYGEIPRRDQPVARAREVRRAKSRSARLDNRPAGAHDALPELTVRRSAATHSRDGRIVRREQKKAAGEALPPSRILTGPCRPQAA